MTPLEQFNAVQMNAGALLAAFVLAMVLGLCGVTRRPALFFRNGRATGPLWAGLATSAAFLSAAPFLGLAGALFVLGSDGLAWIIGLGAGLVLMGVMIAPAFRASGAVTLPEFLALRYEGRLVPLIAGLIVLACSALLLSVQFASIGILSERGLDLPAKSVIGGVALVAAVALGAGGMRAATWLLAALMVALLLAYLTPLAVWGWTAHKMPLGQLAYGQTLQDLRTLEFDMIGAELANPISLKPHLRPFLQIDHTNMLALIVCVMAGTAVLPHVLMWTTVTAGVRQTRLSMAWAVLFSAAVLSAVPAYAALSKQEIYRFVAKGVPFAELPDAFMRHDVAVHGVSLNLYHGVIGAMRAETSDARAVGAFLREDWPAVALQWSTLKPQVQSALMQGALGQSNSSLQQRFETWRASILPVAATAAGNKSGKVTQSAIAVDPSAAAFFASSLAGLAPGWIAVFAIGGILAATGTALATAWAAALALTRDAQIVWRGAPADITERPGTLAPRLAAVVLVVGAAAVALSPTPDLGRMAGWIFSIAAAGLFPALVLGIWWRGATRAGALAGMAGGLALSLLYIGGTHFAPTLFLDVTGALSDAGPAGVKKAADLTASAATASAETKLNAEAAALNQLRGTDFKAGAANWFGIHNSAAAIFALPLGFFLIILISLLTRRPSSGPSPAFDALHRPAAARQAD